MHIIDLNFLAQDQTIASFIVETEEGPILFETGPHSTFPKLKAGIEKAGHKVEDIKHVFLTHIHLDHAGAAWAFANHGATIYVHPRGAKHLANPEKLMSSAKRIYQDKMDSLWGQMNSIPENQIVECADQAEFVFGKTKVKAWHTPGHAVHHIAWQMGKDLIAGDVAGVRINQGFVVPPCPPPDINIEDWQASINLIRGLDLEALYLTHFGKITDLEPHLNSLENILLDWANWMKPHFEAQAKMEEITPIFAAYAAQQLRDYGVDEKGILQYEAANPAWMSVAGLMRYWHKKQLAAS